MRIQIIGSGNVATHLSTGFYQAGHDITEVYSPQLPHAQALAEKVKARAINQINDLTAGADLIIIAVKDQFVPDIIDQLSQQEALVVHTAGSLPMDLFRGKIPRHGVFYPLQTLSKSQPIASERIPICLEASAPEVMQTLRQLARALGGQVHKIDSGQRRQLHLAAVFACNFTNYMYSIASEIAEAEHLPFDLLRPLIKETADKAQHMHPMQAQTGPAIRYDKNVIQKQLELLSCRPDWQKLYKQISQAIHQTHTKNSPS